MTIKQCIKKNGINKSFDGWLNRYINVDINFFNPLSQMEDETEFSVSSKLASGSSKELTSLYSEFCKENNIPNNTVLNISIVEAAETLEMLS